jgi:hypothetical protein
MRVFISNIEQRMMIKELRFDMCLINSKYELYMITIKEHEFHYRDNTILYNRKESCDIIKIYGIKMKYIHLY